MIRLTAIRSGVLGLALVFGVGPVVATAAEFELNLNLSAPLGAGRIGTNLTAGLQAGATSGYDAGVDSLSYRVGPLQAWFIGSAEAGYLKTDLRSGNTTETWSLQVVTPATGTGDGVVAGDPVTLSWNPPVNVGTCTGRELVLTDANANQVVDMATTRTYTFFAPSPGVPYPLDIAIGAVGTSAQSVPATPGAPVAPQQGRRGVLLMWEPVAGDGITYHVERVENPTDGATRRVQRLTDHPLADTRWLDQGAVGLRDVAYRVVAVSGSGCESVASEELLVTVP